MAKERRRNIVHPRPIASRLTALAVELGGHQSRGRCAAGWV